MSQFHHDTKLVERASGYPTIIVSMLVHQFSHVCLMVMALHHHSGDDKISIAKRIVAISGLLKSEVGSDFVRVTPSHSGNCIEAFFVDVHEMDVATLQILRQTKVFYKAKRKCG